ncbi:MAG: 3-dehydroquinate synthase [Burkholderiaceae bacterium]
MKTGSTPIVEQLIVELGERSYPIHIVDGAVAAPASHAGFWSALLTRCNAGRDLVLVTNTTLAPMYGAALARQLEIGGQHVVTIVVEDGEQYKNAAMLEAIHDAMLEARCDRSAIVIALGGGVVGDVAGFTAATYQRGVRFVQIPTTLLAQVDSSVGGKTGINHRLGKNVIGAFHQPQAVVIDLATLGSLPAREFSAGLAEVVKYGASLDARFFEWLEIAMPSLIARNREALAHAIRRPCELKAEIVAHDEREAGRRALLNFGHTFGHAIEGATGYGAWLHGEAVAAGMMLAARLSMRLGAIDSDAVERLRALLVTARLPVEAPSLGTDRWLHWMASDKKADAGRLRFVLLDALGRARVASVADDVLHEVLASSGISRAIEPVTTP